MGIVDWGHGLLASYGHKENVHPATQPSLNKPHSLNGGTVYPFLSSHNEPRSLNDVNMVEVLLHSNIMISANDQHVE